MLRDSCIKFLLECNRFLFALYHYFMDCEKKCLEDIENANCMDTADAAVMAGEADTTATGKDGD